MTNGLGDAFLLIVYDAARRTFSIEGPVLDDIPWRRAIEAQQEAGRTVAYVPCLEGPARRWPRNAAQEFRDRTGFRRVAKGSIVDL